jgi:hypothetical protein
MLIALIIFVGIILLLLIIPLGAEVASENGPSDIFERINALRKSSVRIWEFYDGKLPGKLWKILKRYYNALHFCIHRCDLRVGFQDPAVTGTVYGVACALAACVPDRIPLRLIPDFVTGKSGIDYRISLIFIPARILFETVRTIISLRLWVILRGMRGAGPSAMQTRRQHV